MNRKAVTLAFSLFMMVGLASAGIQEQINNFWNNDAPEAHETLCESFAGWVFSSCHPFKLDGLYADGSVDTVHNGIYTDTAYWRDGRETINLQLQSNTNQSFGIGMAQAKLTAIEHRNNGSDESAAQQAAIEDVDDFYSQQQMRVVRWKNKEVLRFNTSKNKIKDTDGLTKWEVYNKPNNACSDWNYGYTKDTYIEEGNITLYNGTVTPSYGLTADCWRDSPNCANCDYDIGDKVITPVKLSDGGAYLESVSVDGSETIKALNGEPYADTYQKIADSRQRAIDNVNGIVFDIYDRLEAGEVESGDFMGPLEAMMTAGLNYEDSGYYQYRAISGEMAGYATNDSYAFRLEIDNQGVEAFNATGQLFLDKEAFNGTIEKGKTYDVSDTTAFFVFQGESTDSDCKDTTNSDYESLCANVAERIDLNGTFTPLEMTNTDTGESINKTTVQDTSIYTNSVEDLKKQLEDIREDYNELQNTGTIGGAIGNAVGDITSYLNKLFPDLPEFNNSVVGVFLIIIAVVVIRLA